MQRRWESRNPNQTKGQELGKGVGITPQSHSGVPLCQHFPHPCCYSARDGPSPRRKHWASLAKLSCTCLPLGEQGIFSKTQSCQVYIQRGDSYSSKGKCSVVRKGEWMLSGHKIQMTPSGSWVQVHVHLLLKFALFVSLGQHGTSSGLNQWLFCPTTPWGTWQYLKTFLVVTTEKRICWHLVNSDSRCWWKSCKTQYIPPQKPVIQARMSMGPSLRNSGISKDRELR